MSAKKINWYKESNIFFHYSEPLNTGWFRMIDAGLHNISMNVVESLDEKFELYRLHYFPCTDGSDIFPTTRAALSSDYSQHFFFPPISQYKTLYTILMPGLGHVNLLQTSTHNPLRQKEIRDWEKVAHVYVHQWLNPHWKTITNQICYQCYYLLY